VRAHRPPRGRRLWVVAPWPAADEARWASIRWRCAGPCEPDLPHTRSGRSSWPTRALASILLPPTSSVSAVALHPHHALSSSHGRRLQRVCRRLSASPRPPPSGRPSAIRDPRPMPCRSRRPGRPVGRRLCRSPTGRRDGGARRPRRDARPLGGGCRLSRGPHTPARRVKHDGGGDRAAAAAGRRRWHRHCRADAEPPTRRPCA